MNRVFLKFLLIISTIILVVLLISTQIKSLDSTYQTLAVFLNTFFGLLTAFFSLLSVIFFVLISNKEMKTQTKIATWKERVDVLNQIKTWNQNVETLSQEKLIIFSDFLTTVEEILELSLNTQSDLDTLLSRLTHFSKNFPFKEFPFKAKEENLEKERESLNIFLEILFNAKIYTPIQHHLLHIFTHVEKIDLESTAKEFHDYLTKVFTLPELSENLTNEYYRELSENLKNEDYKISLQNNMKENSHLHTLHKRIIEEKSRLSKLNHNTNIDKLLEHAFKETKITK
jgi:hypothetical protein